MLRVDAAPGPPHRRPGRCRRGRGAALDLADDEWLGAERHRRSAGRGDARPFRDPPDAAPPKRGDFLGMPPGSLTPPGPRPRALGIRSSFAGPRRPGPPRAPAGTPHRHFAQYRRCTARPRRSGAPLRGLPLAAAAPGASSAVRAFPRPFRPAALPRGSGGCRTPPGQAVVSARPVSSTSTTVGARADGDLVEAVLPVHHHDAAHAQQVCRLGHGPQNCPSKTPMSW